jgi:aromatic ring-cleaving dioxygenase
MVVWIDSSDKHSRRATRAKTQQQRQLLFLCSFDSAPSSDKVYIDGANPSFIESLMLQIGEEADYDKVIARYRADKLGDATKDMKIVPVNFNKEHKAMLGHCKMILEQDGARIAINPERFDKLITALRTAVDNDGTLNKEATSYNDIFDAFRLALKFYHFEDSSSDSY